MDGLDKGRRDVIWNIIESLYVARGYGKGSEQERTKSAAFLSCYDPFTSVERTLCYWELFMFAWEDL